MSTFIRVQASAPAKTAPAMSTITVTGRRMASEIGFIGTRPEWPSGTSQTRIVLTARA